MKGFRYEDLELVGYIPPEERPKSGWIVVYVFAGIVTLAIVVVGLWLFLAVAS